MDLFLLYLVILSIFITKSAGFSLATCMSLSNTKHLLSQSFDDISTTLGGTGRAKTFWENLRVGNDPSINLGDIGLSEKTRSRLNSEILQNRPLIPVVTTSETASSCGTRKFLSRLNDEQSIESVLIPSNKFDRTTLCVSTQIGCDRGCRFCLTGTMGIIRNLTSAEIISQVIRGIQISRRESMPEMKNIVFMGMGDAGRNIEEVDEAVRCLVDRKRMSMAQSKITVSTVGPSPESFSLLSDIPATLAWSLHSPDNNIRKFLVPSTKHTVEELRDGLLQALLKRPLRNRTIMIAITLIDGINDSLEDAQKTAAFVKPMLEIAPKIMIDLIPYNDISVPNFSKPSTDKVNQFQKFLRSEGLFCSVRVTRGDEESAACGMLATKRVKVVKGDKALL